MGDQISDRTRSTVIQASSVEEVLSKSGILGLMQIMVHISVFVLILTTAYRHGITFFQVHSPPWKCVSATPNRFCNEHQNTTFTVDMEKFNERCRLNRSDWTYTAHHKQYSVVTELDLVCDKLATATLIASLFFIGTAFGALLCGPVGDTYGRKTIIVMSLALALITSVLLAYMQKLWQICVCQFLSGVATSGCTYPAYVYISEISPPKYRFLASNICVIMSILTFLLLDLMACILQNWRQLFLYMGLIGIPSLLCFTFIPETPRWLFAKGRHAKAEEILSKIAQFNGKTKICLQQERDERAQAVVYTYWHLFNNSSILIQTLSMACVWSVVPVLYYTISAQSLNYGGNMYVNYLLTTITDIPATVLATYFLNRFGRKKTTLFSLCGSGLFIGAVVFVPRSTIHRQTLLLSLTVLSKLCCSVAFAGILLWTPEIFPTVLRAQAMSICGTFEKVATIAVPLLCTQLQSVSFCLPFIVMSVISVLGALAGCPLPETKDRPTSDKDLDHSCNSGIFVRKQGLDNGGSTAV